ncbi:ATP-binding protein [Aquabacterium sp.]|uniref:ATP-binding protein n=1 Tax=Aquabacterium sp. TaxID=1872578 RepID=UPI002C5C56D4|nr:ATP-binding protein [Aquabacterium sp.]HSW07162.1 ATP-binding protein [Aquabacterium sp.]
MSAGASLRCVLVLLGLGLVGIGARAATAMDDWRAEAARVRLQAENELPPAYEAAQRLQATLPADAAPADRARALNLLARIETYLALTEPAAEHARQAFELAARHGDKVGQAESDLVVVLNSINQGRLDELVRATTHSVSVLEGVTDRPDLLGEALLRTTVMYRRFEQLDDSIAVAVQAMEIARRANHPLALTYAHHGLAIAYEQSFRPGEMLEHFVQMRDQARAASSRLLEAFAITGLASAKVNSGDAAGGEALGREALVMMRAVGAPYAEAFSLMNLGGNLRAQGRHKEALPLYDAALAIFEKYPNRIGQWFALNSRSEAHQAMGDVAAGHADAERSYAVAKGLGLALYTSGSALRMAAIAAARGDHQQAYGYAIEARELTSQANREKAGVRMLQLIKRYETESRQRQVDELTLRNERQAAELKQRTLEQRWSWSMLGGIAAVLAVTAFFLLRLRRSFGLLAALNVQLEQSRDAVRALNAGLEQRVQDRTAQLRQQARYLRTLIDMLPMWAWLKDTRSRYLVTNQAHAQARGHTADDMVGKSDIELLPPPLAQAVVADDEQVMHSQDRRTTEEALADGGSTVWMETYKAPVLDEDGTLLGTVGVARNISDRKATEAAREEALAEARRLARMRSDFLAQMSHELRTPLNAILGFAQLLQNGEPLSEAQARGLGIIAQSGTHLLALINDLLDLSRIDAGKLDLHAQVVELTPFLNVVADIVRVKADEKGLDFRVEAAPGLPAAVRIDDMRLRQVLLNLLSNAVKFTDRGQVCLRVGPLVAPPHDGTAASVRLRFEVEDKGIGMSPEQLSRIFQPFEQVAEAPRRTGGAGLGLTISRQLVRLMGGDILVRSQPGQGSAFWFDLDLPVCGTLARTEAPQGRIVGYEGPRRKALVVDDAPALRTLLTDALRQVGFEVRTAGDGRAGLEAAQQVPPDVILMDMAMPVMDGLEATRRIRGLPALQGIKIIAMSSAALQDAQPQCLAAGADAFIAKPIEPQRLVETVGAWLGVAWVRELPRLREAAQGRTAPASDRLDMVLPPRDELLKLDHLSKIGRMLDICAQADVLKAEYPRCEVFASRVHSLAKAHQSRAISILMRQCLASSDEAQVSAPSGASRTLP